MSLTESIALNYTVKFLYALAGSHDLEVCLPRSQKGHGMSSRITRASVLALIFVGTVSLPAQKLADNRGSWSGVIVNSSCTADEAFTEAAKCTEKVPGTKLVLFDDTTRQIFDLDSQDKAIGNLGDAVTVHGRLSANTIRVSSLELLTSVGLPVGRKAPAFSARDQFGHEQTLETLKGSRGTILLFFRSADW
jgi:hypothetical protein